MGNLFTETFHYTKWSKQTGDEGINFRDMFRCEVLGEIIFLNETMEVVYKINMDKVIRLWVFNSPQSFPFPDGLQFLSNAWIK